MSGTGEELQSILERLEAIGEELADLALAQLQLAAGEEDDAAVGHAADTERRLTRARRAVEKAAALLRERSDNA